jgi:hypothetical protein
MYDLPGRSVTPPGQGGLAALPCLAGGTRQVAPPRVPSLGNMKNTSAAPARMAMSPATYAQSWPSMKDDLAPAMISFAVCGG